MSRPITILATVAALALAGCLAPTEEPVETASVAPPAADVALPTPEVLEWSGWVLTSRGEAAMHIRPTEDVLWPVEQEGILAEIPEGVTDLEVALSWDGPGEFMIMLHSHKGEGGYVEHITDVDDVNPKCLRVPAADVTPGHWQVMVHSDGAQMTDFTLSVLTVGGKATMVEDERHGHMPTEFVTGFEIEEHEIEACTMWTPPAAEE